MVEKKDKDFSRLGQSLMVTRVTKANGQVFDVSKSGKMIEADMQNVLWKLPE